MHLRGYTFGFSLRLLGLLRERKEMFMETPKSTVFVGKSTVHIAEAIVRGIETEWKFVVPTNFCVTANLGIEGGEIKFSCNQ